MINLFLDMLIVAIIFTVVSLLLLIRNFYKYLRIPQVYSLVITGSSFLVSEILEILILFSSDLSFAGGLAIGALIMSNMGFAVFLLFLESLRSPKISKLFFSTVIFILSLKMISLILAPIKLQITGSVISRQLALTPIQLIPTLILIFIFAGQAVDLAMKALGNPKKANFLLWILICWILPMILTLGVYFVATHISNDVSLTYVQYMSMSLGLVLLAIFISRKQMELFAMPINLIGILVSTSTGVLILKEVYDRIRSSAVDFASILAGIVSILGQKVHIKTKGGEIAKIVYPELTYLMYSTRNLTIILVLNGDNSFIRSMLRSFGKELDSKIGQTESIITDYEINITKELIQKYFSFIYNTR